MAQAMVMEYGMSEKLGWLRYRANQEEVFLGHSVARSQNVSEETSKLIDQEVRRLVEEGETTARRVLTDNLDELHRLAGALLEFETLTGEESKKAIRGEDIGREDPLTKPPLIAASGASIPSTRRPRGGGGGGGIGDPAPQGA
jgi:cell division protease FtsH